MQENKEQNGLGDTSLTKVPSFYGGLGDNTPYPAQKFKNKRKNPVKRYKFRSSIKHLNVVDESICI